MLLVDGNNWAWRAHFSGRGLASRGRPTAVLHVGLTMLAAVPNLFTKQRLVFLWDSRTCWRKEILPEYKANRADVSSEKRQERTAVYRQADVFRTVLRELGIGQLEVPDLEADDLAGIMTQRARQVRPNWVITLLSSDRDWFQLLDDRAVVQVRGWKGRKKDVWTAERVLKEYGVRPERWPEYLALVGDAGDNIPKLRPGVGPKTAVRLMGDTALSVESQLNGEELKKFRRNFQVASILRTPPQGVTVEIDRKKSEKARRLIEDVLSEYELFQLWGSIERLCAVGQWGPVGR